MASKCKHTNKTEKIRCFTGPVGKRRDPRADGNTCTIETCDDCGAVRKTNVNQCYTETSGWMPRVD